MPCGDPEIQERVIEETLEQAEFFSNALGIPKVETAYIGGGTPSVLSGAVFSRLLGGLPGAAPMEWTVEANPESIDRRFLETCAAHGVTRISIGMQTGNDALLGLLGRPGRSTDNARALETISGSWTGETSLDFLAGIPGQNPRDIEADLGPLAESGIGHVSLYSLTVEPDTELSRRVRRGEIRLDPEETREELWFHGKELLEKSGYLHYEISNFARPGRECRHNMRYWRLEPYVGVGPGAVSTLPAAAAAALGHRIADAAGKANVLRLSNPRTIEGFLSGRKGLWGLGVEPVSDTAFLLETLMMGLRTSTGIPQEGFRRRFGGRMEDFFPGRWARWIDEGIAQEDAASLRLTEKGRLRLDRLLHEIAGDISRGPAAAPRLQWP